MKVSVVLPVVDVPIGSGKPHYFLKQCVQSVLDGEHEDFELLVGSDGHHPQIHDLLDDFRDKRIVYVPFERTRSWGNHQCHKLLKEWAKGDIVMWMNHDDCYYPGALRIAAEEAECFPERPIFFRARIACNVVVWMKEERPVETSSHVQVHVLATATPIRPWTPPYPDMKARIAKADMLWVQQVYDTFSAKGYPPVWSKDVLVNVRPWALAEPTPFGCKETTPLESS
jgi:glycosyltransferase involved in cell wall biosynthesis